MNQQNYIIGNIWKTTINNTYKEHQVFILLSEYADFYKSIALSKFGF